MTNQEASNTLHDHVALIFEAIKEMAPHCTKDVLRPVVEIGASLNQIKYVADDLWRKQ